MRYLLISLFNHHVIATRRGANLYNAAYFMGSQRFLELGSPLVLPRITFWGGSQKYRPRNSEAWLSEIQRSACPDTSIRPAASEAGQPSNNVGGLFQHAARRIGGCLLPVPIAQSGAWSSNPTGYVSGSTLSWLSSGLICHPVPLSLVEC